MKHFFYTSATLFVLQLAAASSCSKSEDALHQATNPNVHQSQATGATRETTTGDSKDATTAGTVYSSEHDASGEAQSTNAASRAACKRGTGYGHYSAADMETIAQNTSWWYNWSATPDKDVAGSYAKYGMEYVPMVWGGSYKIADLLKQIPADAKYLLTFNEPNFKSQSNLSPEQAASHWPDIESVAKQKNLKIVSPALNYCGPAADCWETDPFVYLDKFFAACTGCQVDFIAVHWYACSESALTAALQKYEKYGKPLWVTEFACGDGNDQQQSLSGQRSYMKTAVQALENDPNVFRYAWFSSRTTAIPNVDLLSNSGSLTTLGQDYETAATNAANPCH